MGILYLYGNPRNGFRIKARYKPITGELSPNTAIAQAASALDVAAQLAIDSKNPINIMQVAMAWAELSQVLTDEPEEQEKEQHTPFQLGFSTQISKQDEEPEYEEDDE